MKNLTTKLLTMGLLATVLSACGGGNDDIYGQYMLNGQVAGCDYQPQSQPDTTRYIGTFGGQGSMQMLMYPVNGTGNFEAQAMVDINNFADAYMPGYSNTNNGGFNPFGGINPAGSCPTTRVRFCVTTQGGVARLEQDRYITSLPLANGAGQRVTIGTTASGASPAVINGTAIEGSLDITYNTGCSNMFIAD